MRSPELYCENRLIRALWCSLRRHQTRITLAQRSITSDVEYHLPDSCDNALGALILATLVDGKHRGRFVRGLGDNRIDSQEGIHCEGLYDDFTRCVDTLLS
jgi:hypothetical protein